MSDSTTNIPQLQVGQGNPERQINELFDAASTAMVYGRDASNCSGRVFAWLGGGGPFGDLSNGTSAALTASTTQYMVADRATGAVSFSSSNTNWNDTVGYARVYLLTIGTDTITDYQDYRFRPFGTHVTTPIGDGVGLLGLTFISDALSASPADPGAGNFRWNNDTQTSATELLFDNATFDAITVNTFYASLAATGFIYIQQSDNTAKWQLWKYTAVTSQTGYYKFAVTLQAATGEIDDLTLCYVLFQSDGSGGGGGGSTQGKQAIYIAAGSMTPSLVAGCANLTTIASASNQPDIQTLNFDPTTQEYAQFSIAMPKKWNEGTVTFKAYWSHAATTTNFGVVWDLQAVAVSDDDAIAVAYGTAQTSTDTGGTTNDLYSSPESSAITVAGTPAAEDMVFFRLSRVTGNGSDTMAIDARLHGITLFVTTDADTDA